MNWIDVKSCLPKPFVPVLCYIPGEKLFPTVGEGFITKDGRWVVAFWEKYHLKVTHWAEMPVFPGDDEE